MCRRIKISNELLIEILKQIHVRLDRLDAKIDTKAGKEDINALRISVEKDINEVKADISSLKNDVNTIKGEVSTLGQRLDRIEGGIATLRWVIGAQVAIIGVPLGFIF